MKNFLVTTPIKETYGPPKKNIFLGSWCFVNDIDNLKKNKILKYHWSNKKKFKKDAVYINKTTDKFCKILSRQLNKIHNLNEDFEYWNLLIYPWAHNYVSTMYERWGTIKNFTKLNKKKIFSSYQLKIDEKKLVPINNLNFIKNTYTDIWNHLTFLRIIKHLRLRNVKTIKKGYSYFDTNSDVDFQKGKNNTFDFLISIYELLFAKLAFRFNRIILESFSFSAKEFLKLSIKNRLIPSLYKNLFEDIGSKKDLDFERRKIDLKSIKENKFNDKFLDFLLENLVYDLPMSYFENFLKIKNKMSYLANKKKLIISMRSWNYNDQFKICAAELKKKESKYFTCEHGGGLMGEYIHQKNFIGKITSHIHYDSDSSYKKKSFRLSPTINVIDHTEIDTKKNVNLNITFLEGLKYSHKLTSLAKAEEGIDQIKELLKFVENLPIRIKDKVILRSKRPFTLNIKDHFTKKFGKYRFNDWEQIFFDYAKTSKLMIVNYPQTAFSSLMYYNVPTILICNKKFWFFRKKSLKMFNLLKKNKMAFENFEDAERHIIKNWDGIYHWWNNKKIQNIRKLYLKNFFNIKNNWFEEWLNFISIQKKKLFKIYH